MFVSLLTLDVARQESNRYDLICCIKAKKDSSSDDDQKSIMVTIFHKFYAPFVFHEWVWLSIRSWIFFARPKRTVCGLTKSYLLHCT